MKILIVNSSNVVKYQFDDEVEIVLEPTRICVPGKFNIGDINSSNTTLVEGLDAADLPEDWIGNKYLYADNTFTLDPDYLEPTDD